MYSKTNNYSVLNNIISDDTKRIIFIGENRNLIYSGEMSSIIESWETADIPNDVWVTIENILQRLKSDDINGNQFIDEDIIIDALNKKILERESIKNPKKSNKDAFHDMALTNTEIDEKMNFIESKTKNGKEINYISIRNDDNTVDVLVCRTETDIQDYIKKCGSYIPSRTAKEIFYDMNNKFRVSLNFKKLSEYYDDPSLSKQEEINIRNSVASFGLEGHIYIAIDCFQEKIYKIADAIFKFDLSKDGSIEFLQEPRNMKNLNKQEEKKDNFLDTMLSATVDPTSEPEESYKELEAIDEYEKEENNINEDVIKDEVKPKKESKNNKKSKIVEEAIEESIPDDKFDETAIDLETTNYNNFYKLLDKVQFGGGINHEEVILLSNYIVLIANDLKESTIETDHQQSMYRFYNTKGVQDLYDRAKNSSNNKLPEELPKELYDALQYYEYKLDSLIEQKEIQEETPDDNREKRFKTNGAALGVVILEIAIVALIIMAIYSMSI